MSATTAERPVKRTNAKQRIELGYTPRVQFIPFHKRRQRWACVVTHRRAGKTVASVMDLIDKALRHEKGVDARYSYIAPTYAQAKDTVWQYVKRFTANVPRVDQRESDLTVQFAHNGARVRLYGSDTYDRLRGGYADGVVLDEFGDWDPRAWPEVIRPALADRKGWAVFIGTPKGKNQFWEIHKQAREDDAWYSLVLKASETGLLPPEELDDLKRSMSTAAYDQELECSFESPVAGAVYARELAEATAAGRITKVTHNPSLPVHVYFDLGFADHTALWFVQHVQGEIRLIDHHEENGHPFTHYMQLLQARGYTYGTMWLPHDAQAKSLGTGRSIEEMARNAGWRVQIVKRLSIEDGINACRVMFANMWFDETRCERGLLALRNYAYKADIAGTPVSKEPIHNWASHCFIGETKVLTRYGTCQIKDLPPTGEVLTPCGWRPYRSPRITLRNAPLVEVAFADGLTVRCTPDHMFLTESGWLSASDLQPTSQILSSLTLLRSISMASSIAYGQVTGTFRAAAATSIAWCGKRLLGLFQLNAIFITETMTLGRMPWPTLSASQAQSICPTLGTNSAGAPLADIVARMEHGASTSPKTLVLPPPNGTAQRKGVSGIDATPCALKVGLSGSGFLNLAKRVAAYFRHSLGLRETRNIAPTHARHALTATVSLLDERADVWDLTVPGIQCFSLANGAVVHNSSDALRHVAVAMQEAKQASYEYRDTRPPFRQLDRRGNLGTGWMRA